MPAFDLSFLTRVFLLFGPLCASAALLAAADQPAAPHLVFARDHGAVPGQDGSSTEAIRRALDAAQEHVRITGQLCEVRFEPGRYRLAPQSDVEGWRIFRLSEARRLTINGNGAEFVITHPRYGFASISGCEDIEIRDLTIDYDPLPFSAGYVRAVHLDLNAIDVEAVDPHPPLDAPHFTDQRTYGYPLDPDVPGRLRDGSHNVYFAERTEPVSGRVFRIHMRSPTGPGQLRDLRVGDKWTQLSRQGGGDLFMVSSSRNVTLRDIVSYAATSGHYVSANSSGLKIIACRALIKPGRWKGGNADGIHVQNPRSGPVVEDCHFEGLGDDGVNIYRRPFKAVARLATNELVLETLPRGAFAPGDEVEFFDPLTGLIGGTARIVSIDLPGRRLVLDAPAGDIRTGTGREATQIYRKSPGQEFAVRNTRFLNLRRHGVIAKTGGLIEGCLFSGTSNAALAVMNEPAWPEGLYADRTVIRGNTFEHSGFEHGGKIPTIDIRANSIGGPMTTPGLHGVVEIEGNTFSHWRHAALALRNTTTALIRDNRFEPGADSGPALRLAHNSDVTVEQNTFPSGTAPGTQVIDEGGNGSLRILP